LLETIASATSIIGAILNGAGTGFGNTKLMFIGQLTWVISNACWIKIFMEKKDMAALATFATFFLAALSSVVLIIVRGN
jgi:hypothetical protein